MDLLVLIVVACVLCLKNSEESAYIEEEILVRETRLNPDFYVDENAFMEVANVLGFGNISSSSACTDGDLRSKLDDDIPVFTENIIQSQGSRDSNQLESSSFTGGSRRSRMDRMARPNS